MNVLYRIEDVVFVIIW